MLPEGIKLLDIRRFENKHQNFEQKLVRRASYHLSNPASLPNTWERYRATTLNMQWLIAQARKRKYTLRALGSGWSFSEVAVTNGGLIDTKGLRMVVQPSEADVATQYLATGKSDKDLIFTQCGVSIMQLNTVLENQLGRSLKASGASNGQTVVGATATGTHGSAFGVGAVHDSLVGMHIVVGENRHVWIECASNPVVSDVFLQKIGAELIQNDEIFNAAVVSFGSFGIVHGLMFETAPLFLLKEYKTQVSYDSKLQKLIKSLDFEHHLDLLPKPTVVNAQGLEQNDSSICLPDDLYHFELLINPHNLTKDVHLKVFYRKNYYEGYPKRIESSPKFEYGDDLLGIVQTLIDNVGDGLVPALVNRLSALATDSQNGAEGTIGETFNSTKLRGKTASAAMGLELSRVEEALDIILEQNKHTPLPGAISLRFVKGTKALLGFTRFETTCILELDGVDSETTRAFYEAIWESWEAAGIPFTLHWGKINFGLSAERVKSMYGEATVKAWLQARSTLMDQATQQLFNNAFMKRVGLDAFELPVLSPPTT